GFLALPLDFRVAQCRGNPLADRKEMEAEFRVPSLPQFGGTANRVLLGKSCGSFPETSESSLRRWSRRAGERYAPHIQREHARHAPRSRGGQAFGKDQFLAGAFPEDRSARR